MRKKMKRDKWSLRPIYKLDAMVKIEGEENKKKQQSVNFTSLNALYEWERLNYGLYDKDYIVGN